MNVRLIPFGRLAKDATSAFNKLDGESFLPVGKVPIIDQGKAAIAGYTNDEGLAVSLNNPVVVFGDHTQIFKYVDHAFVLGADGTKVLEVDLALIDPLYFYHVVRTARFPDKGYSRYFKYLKKQSFPVPVDIDDQRRIAALLSRAEWLIAQRKESLHLIDELVRSVFLEMFGDPARNEKGWKKKPLDKLGDVSTGKTPPSAREGMFVDDVSSNAGMPFVTPGDLESKEPIMRHVSEAGAAFTRPVRSGATLVCCIGATIGKVGQAVGTSAFNQQINAIEWHDASADLFGEVLMRLMKPVIKQLGGTNTTLPILKKSKFEKVKVIDPGPELKLAFALRMNAIAKLRRSLVQCAQSLEQLSGSLSQRAFRGELKSSIAPDHKASSLKTSTGGINA